MDRHFFQQYLASVVIPGDTRIAIDFLQRYGLLNIQPLCEICTDRLEFFKRASLGDGYAWRCISPKCNKNWHSVRKGSFFANSKIELRLWIHVLWLWAIETSVKDAVLTSGIGEKTIIKMYKDIREMCGAYINKHPIRLGGNGINCSLDESCFSHKPKYHRGRAPLREIWVFGIVDTSFSPSRAFLKVVSNRSEATIFPIIQDVCRPGSIISTDSAGVYTNIYRKLGFSHRQVNHSDRQHRFVSSEGAHTQHIESYWGKRKLRIKAMKGIKREVLQEYLNEFMWRDIFYNNCFIHLLDTIKEQYPF